MVDTERKLGWFASLLDVTIKTYLALILLVWITGGISLDVGPVGFSSHKAMSLLRVLIPIFLVRWLLTSRLSWEPFSIGTRLRTVFLRTTEIGIVAHVILIPLIWHLDQATRIGEFKSWFFRSPDLGQSVVAIFLLLWVRFLLARNLRGIMAISSLVITLLVVFVGLEVFLRNAEAKLLVAVANEVEGPTISNDIANFTWGHRVVKNSYGYREKEFTVPKPEGLFRIMVLGDSVTWGQGVAQNRRYTAVLDSLIEKTNPKQPVEVLNFGVIGKPTVFERELLARLHEEVDPDLIVVGFCLNDPQHRAQNYSVERTRLHGFYSLIASLRHIGLKNTYAFLIERIDLVFARLDAIPNWQEALDRTYQLESPEWNAFLLALDDIKIISDRRQLPPPVFLLLITNTASDNPNPPWESGWFAQAGAAAKERGFVVVDPTDRFVMELSLENLPVNSQDDHPSAACNRIYGEELFRAVQPTVLGADAH